MKLATLCYVRANGRTLMMHRIKKPDDMHAGKWNGLGGKLLPGETPQQCAVREVEEECGLTLIDPLWRGILTFPAFNMDEDWYTFVFVGRQFTGELIDSNEGVLAWVEDEKLYDLDLWDGDRIFLKWLDLDVFFSGQFIYRDGELVKHDVTFYTPNQVFPPQRSAPTRHSSFADPAPKGGNPLGATNDKGQRTRDQAPRTNQPVYLPADDTYCWTCGGPVVKRHCKIVCKVCGFTRDCSDP
jgi:8-oxo-dGTP diphosphatase